MTPCPACPRERNPVPGQGPLQCEVAACGEGPGRIEDKIGLPFQGQAGDEYNDHYLPLGGLTRRQVYTTNAVHCKWSDGGNPPPPWLVKSCTNFHLREELRIVQPKILLLMGGVAASLLGEDFDIERQHGIPIRGATILGYRPEVVIPTLHPALGLHQKSSIKEVRADFLVVKAVREGTYQPVKPPEPPILTLIRDRSEFPRGKGPWGLPGRLLRLAIDTESVPGGAPFCLTFATSSRGGYLIYANDWGTLGKFQDMVDATDCPIFFHNLTYDYKVCRAMGLDIPWERCYDTMMRAFHRGLPQALKTLGFRLLGMRMRDFNDVVRPHSLPKQLDYITKAAALDWPKPAMRLVGDGIDVPMEYDETLQSLLRKRGSVLKEVDDVGNERRYMSDLAASAASLMVDIPAEQITEARCVPYQPQPMSRKLNLALQDFSKGDLEDLQERWKGWPESQQAEVEARCGPFPWHSIAYVPEHEMSEYAITDAVATYRLVDALEERWME